MVHVSSSWVVSLTFDMKVVPSLIVTCYGTSALFIRKMEEEWIWGEEGEAENVEEWREGILVRIRYMREDKKKTKGRKTKKTYS